MLAPLFASFIHVPPRASSGLNSAVRLHSLYLIFLALKGFSKPRTPTSSFIPKDHIDLFLTCISSVATVTGVSTLEMEFSSNSQLIFLTILMFVGGEAFNYRHAWTSSDEAGRPRFSIHTQPVIRKLILTCSSGSSTDDHNEVAVVTDHPGR
ncbi:UNVERIFIED_CONTAM: Sodium transporter HKT1 [Sesamum latifolium]|uniref:Sodium transporter HKT1 n=1 Tax=Sesamum latifolium TaxID=2727402 RepID=A0AAW2U1R0_9LAMI